MTNHTIRECLDTLEATALGDYATVLLQFQYIKKCYRTKILATHPDKGGDPAVFRQVQASFEVLRELHATGAIGDSFETAAQHDVDADAYYAQCWEDFGSTTFSWEYYYAATETVEPGYRIELAKSGRSKCKKKSNQKGCQHGNQPGDDIIEKDSIRIGSLLEETGSYGRWFHLACWRVPSKVWLGLPQDEGLLQDEQAVLDALQKMNLVLLSGLEDLSDQDKLQVFHHVSNKENWAKLVKRKKPPKDAIILVEENEAEQGVAEPDNRSNKRTDIATARREYIPPVPTPDTKNNFAGKTFVLTGIFPEIGGGTGLSLGKARVKALIESFGGRVTGSISGKTDVLVVGKEPGYSKVQQARSRPKVRLVSLMDLTQLGMLEAGVRWDDAADVKIPQFSSGYGNNGLALTASKKDLALAAGVLDARLLESSKDEEQPPAKKKRNAAPKAVKKVKQIAYKISCDGCGTDCTKKSWYVNDTDWCSSCAKGKKNVVMQVNGVTVS